MGEGEIDKQAGLPFERIQSQSTERESEDR